jgi:ubiquitin carboxyl-terminal hydrolase 25/28
LRKTDLVESDEFEKVRIDAASRSGEENHMHDFILVGKQSTPESHRHAVVSCVCSGCDYHVVLKTSYELDQEEYLCNTRGMSWPTSETQFLAHHLVWVGSLSAKEIEEKKTKYHPVVAVEHFACSAPPCTFELTLEISEPRMPMTWTRQLLDPERVRKQFYQAKIDEPERFADAKEDWVTSAVATLNTYVKDVLESGGRNISKRNKRFHVVFGEGCYPIFRALEFKEEAVDKDGVAEECFVPASLEPTSPDQRTELDTLRAYLEDVRSEIQNLIVRQGNTSSSVNLASAAGRIDKALHCFQYPKVSSAADPDLAEYKILGVTPDCVRDLMLYAFHRQVALSPKKRRLLADSLGAVASQPPVDSFLQEAAVIEMTKPSEDGDEPESGMTLAKALRLLEIAEGYPTELILDISRRKVCFVS